jgi:hypothetical protein
MSFQAVKALRQAGKLEEALALAYQLLEAAPELRWNKLAAAWVHYDLLKQHAEAGDIAEGITQLRQLQALQLSSDEKMIFDQCAWQVRRLLSAWQKVPGENYTQVDDLFAILQTFHFTRPSEAYSVLYQGFHKILAPWSKHLEFADWWQFDHFRPEDYQAQEFKGKKTMALVEQAYLAYAKKLLAGVQGSQRDGIHERIRDFLPRLDRLIQQHPEYQYPIYFKVKLHQALGDTANLVSVFLPFARQKRNDYWVWQLLADIHESAPDLQLACYCKALALKTPEEFLGKVRLSMAAVLLERQMYAEAKTEIEQLSNYYQSKGWKLPPQLVSWKTQDWYHRSTAHPHNQALYRQHAPLAEASLYEDIPEEIVAVAYVNAPKHILHFIKNQHQSGYFRYAGQLSESPRIGDVLAVRFQGEGKDNHYKTHTIRITQPPQPCAALKTFEGPLKILLPQNIGFVQDVFVEPAFLHKHKLVQGQHLSGKALLSFNPKKQKWGWKAVSPF